VKWPWSRVPDPDDDSEKLPKADQRAADEAMRQAHMWRSDVDRQQSRVDFVTDQAKANRAGDHFAYLFGESMRRRSHGSG